MTSYQAPFKILGSGSNIVISNDVEETLLKNEIKGIEIIDENANSCLVKVGGGENWHNFVMWAVFHDLGGLENLAFIPGTVGAAPIQNIGAYGVEQDSSFHSATVVDMESGVTKTFFKKDCRFGYRESIFKHIAKDQYFIADVTYLLKKNHIPNTTYKDIQKYLEIHNISNPSVKEIASAVIDIRSKKLPDPKVIGNAGSFFKNPIVSLSKASQLKEVYPELPIYPIDQTQVKIPAAWLIEQCGFKGIVHGNTGTFDKQALVIVNHGNATGEEILNFALEIQNKVYETFEIELDPEVNIW